MTTRDFDPVLSAALRNELEALADGAGQASPARAGRQGRPHVWITAVTAAALLLATLGVLRLTGVPVLPATAPAVPSPLSQITDPDDPNYVARAVRVLLEARGTGPSTQTMDVPPDVIEATRYFTCAPSAEYGLSVGGSDSGGTCDRTIGGSVASAIEPGVQTVEITVPEGVEWAVVIIEEPAPTISTGPLIDPLRAVRDRMNPDALEGDVEPVLQSGGLVGEGTISTRLLTDPRRLRVYLVCAQSSPEARLRIEGRDFTGCMNSIAHWVDYTPATRDIEVGVTTTGPYRLLVVPAPEGATDSPESAVLPWPTDGAVAARARGAGAPASGTYVRNENGITLVITCRGTGFLEVETGDGSTATRGTACGGEPSMIGFGVGGPDDPRRGEPQPWTAIPHGDISWTLEILLSS